MRVIPKANGDVVVECGDQSVTITGAAPADPGAGTEPTPRSNPTPPITMNLMAGPEVVSSVELPEGAPAAAFGDAGAGLASPDVDSLQVEVHGPVVPLDQLQPALADAHAASVPVEIRMLDEPS